MYSKIGSYNSKRDTCLSNNTKAGGLTGVTSTSIRGSLVPWVPCQYETKSRAIFKFTDIQVLTLDIEKLNFFVT